MRRQLKDNKKLLKKGVVYFAITLAIGVPLYIRNIVVFGTPMWPFMNSVFTKLGMIPFPYTSDSFPVASLAHFANPQLPLISYLDFFGVPLGLPQNLFSLPVPWYFFVGWFAITILFCIPLITGAFSKLPKKLGPLVWAWILSYVVMLCYYVFDYGEVYMRLVLPMFPALAILWAVGFDRIHKRLKGKYKKGLIILLILICTAFSTVEVVKANVASAQYATFDNDYQWVRDNIPNDARFDRHSTYLIYHTNKNVVSTLCSLDRYDEHTLYHYSDPLVEPNGPSNDYDDWQVIYTNPKTNVKVLKKTKE